MLKAIVHWLTVNSLHAPETVSIWSAQIVVHSRNDKDHLKLMGFLEPSDTWQRDETFLAIWCSGKLNQETSSFLFQIKESEHVSHQLEIAQFGKESCGKVVKLK